MLYEIAWMFMIYGVLGWFWETPYISIKERKFINRGFLRSPFIPIYGFAAISIILSMQWLSKSFVVNNIFLSFIFSFVFISAIASLCEYVTSYVMEIAFSARWWDYSDRKLNLNGRIAFIPSLFWGFIGYILWHYVNPLIMLIIYSIPKIYAKWILSFFYLIISIDTITTLSELVQFRIILSKIHGTSEKIYNLLLSKIENMEEIFDQKSSIVSIIQNAKAELKLNTKYRKLESIKDFGEFMGVIRSKAKSILNGQEKTVEEFSEILLKFKKYNRFSKKYPNALTKKLPYVFSFLRDKRKL
jgi:uncharacterized membrane protein